MTPTTSTPATFHGNRVDQQFIAGQWRDGATGQRKTDINPYTDDVVAEFTLATEEDLDEAYRAAAEAQKAWAATGPGERSAVLRRAAAIMEECREEIADWLVKESGSTRIKAAAEIGSAIAITYEAATFPTRVHGTIHPSNVPNREMRVYRKPIGVVGVISPWNFPLHLSQRSVAPALALGNAVVLKPASDTPVTGGTLLARVFEEAGLPAGVLSVVVGAGSEIGDAFVKHPAPRLISFTGSTPVGKQVGANAVSGDTLKKVALELGGNAPLVVLDDADLDAAVDQAVQGGYLHSGQICMSVQRVIVDEKVYDEFLPKYEAAVRGLKVGDPDAEGVLVGPVINDTQLETLKKKIASAEADGARALVGGEITGRVVPPFIWVDATPDMEITREEIFGPMTVVLQARDEQHALELANDHEFGLSSSVFTQDLDRGLRFAEGTEAGMTYINQMSVQDEAHVAFGGARNSGLGRFNGEWAIEEFTTDHTIGVTRLG
ncbi:aldehyde dehydrogenase family protein [Micrococcus lylae]|uniref:Aldehyde dehydrogenase (NAD+) n=2 Tax=Micrococcus TaxID=1269 RepID=A0ABR6DYS3_9MICC|nr:MULTISPECIES: aldehyde dehydrogenase family protein [Micrococcus]KYK03709.1 aldehyde dehydrogenase [Micrococcus sp. CH3]KYK04655.1 aldehyde dehydrogenase [Micrococcus sp. CH7]MBA9081443.1 aldehyde dehydrogenase (NAD+) [Micrococcus aloeverae]MBU8793596.1 aldehyde dehydrogenase family protein [Micrococcus luteus]MCF8560375.1 aldehyde dehydrogenase family protein [Micrococcus yunnanensis]